MIARISGRLEEVRGAAALIDTGDGLWYEVMLAACDTDRLARRVGQEVVLHTIHHIEGDPARGQMAPRLVGFLTETDRDFFSVFTTVKGIGVRKALRALVRSPADIAAAIQGKDTNFLIALPEIGKRTAETIIAQLHGKVEEFAGKTAPGGREVPQIPEAGTEALAVLTQLGERRSDAMALVERVLAADPDLQTPEEIIQHAYRLKAGGA
ncbi:MAG: Holliday junction branch migration protein RuvA [Phycisphaerae bacterium]|jgi:Holliday junction DNA helicase RuvA|nr:Holliday junction branch migration protein RuvA [Phycisphaerae bacterium]MDP7636387.1 Holliday junction branch migration protein RuvA [Phycisphaerae bacterium]